MERLAEQNMTAETVETGTGTESTTGVNMENKNMENNNDLEAKRMLYRHPQDRIVGGICGGISDLTGMDANLVRILWVIATLATGGGGILAYIALWALLPVGTSATGEERPAALALSGANLGRTAVILIALGGVWLLANIGALPWLWGGFWRVMNIVFWPALLIGVGYLLLIYTGRNNLNNKWKMNWNWRETKDRVQSGMGERMPTKQSFQQSLRTMRDHFPLKRTRTDRIFMGVCGGISQRIGVDSNLVRLVWAAFSVGSVGMGVLIYVLLGLMLPQEQVTALQSYSDDAQDVQVIDGRSTHL